jgi:predicted DNA-binding transcriptional regulator YafY
MDHSIAEAALRLGVTKRTAERYEAALQDMEGAAA